MNLIERFNRFRFERALRTVANTPAIQCTAEGPTLLSMVHHRDVLPYLLAVKSFNRFIPPSQVVVVMDPTITEEDQQILRRHVPGIELRHAEDYREEGIPQGGCWERLIAISEYVADSYVIQLDADTVTLRDIPEIRDAVRTGTSFVLATEDNQDFVSCSDIALWAERRLASGEHVQILAESRLGQFKDHERLRYVRGCAGFSGFACGSLSRDKLREFSSVMSSLLGDRWSQWGTEQFASNFMVANSPLARVLPHPKYCHPGRETAETVFLHFIGYVRFITGRYAQVTHEVCASLGT